MKHGQTVHMTEVKKLYLVTYKNIVTTYEWVTQEKPYS